MGRSFMERSFMGRSFMERSFMERRHPCLQSNNGILPLLFCRQGCLRSINSAGRDACAPKGR